MSVKSIYEICFCKRGCARLVVWYPCFKVIRNHRRIQGVKGAHIPLELINRRLIKTSFNIIFPISSLSLFILPRFVIFTLNYTSVSFWFFIKGIALKYVFFFYIYKKPPPFLLLEITGFASADHTVNLPVASSLKLPQIPCRDSAATWSFTTVI